MSLVSFISFPAAPATVRQSLTGEERRKKKVCAGVRLGDGGGEAEDGEECGGEQKAAAPSTGLDHGLQLASEVVVFNFVKVLMTEFMIQVKK